MTNTLTGIWGFFNISLYKESEIDGGRALWASTQTIKPIALSLWRKIRNTGNKQQTKQNSRSKEEKEGNGDGK